MSAFLVDRRHIDLLVKLALEGPRGIPVNPMSAWHAGYYLREEGGGVRTPDRLGALLWAENLRSIEARYPGDGERPGPCGLRDAEIAGYTYTDPYYRPTLGEALQALFCYEYQSCEHEGWEASDAAALCRRLVYRLAHYMPGCDAAPWEWRDETINKARAGTLYAKRAS